MAANAATLNPTAINPASTPALFANRGQQVVGASVTLLVLPTVAVALRLLSRWMSKAGLWWDDYTVILAMIFSWGPNLVNLIGSQHGFGRHLAILPNNAVFIYFRYLYAFELLYTLAMSSVKYSIILFRYRIFPIVQFRRILMVALAFVIAFTIAIILVCIFQCVPVRDFWDSIAGVLSPELGGRCIKVQLYFLVSGGINTVTDFALLALPIPVIWRLRTGLTQKLILTGIFLMGLTVCAVSIIRLVVLSQLDESDITWNYVPVSIWTAAEPSIAVVSACIPSLRPLFVRVVWGGTYRTKEPRTNSSYLSSWRSGAKEQRSEGSFNRLHEVSTNNRPDTSSWRHNVAVYGGKNVGSSDDYELGEGGTQLETPINRIRAKTTVVLTISERLEWKDELF